MELGNTHMNLTRFAAPAIVGFVCAFLCRIPKSAGAVQPQRPPAYVFGIIWPVLYILIGLAWQRSREDVIFVFLTALLGLWIVLYGCVKDKKASLYVLSAVVATTVAAIAACASGDKMASYALIPLLTWTQIALMLNWHDVK